MGLLSQLRLHGYFGPVYLLQVSKNDDEERCFLKYLSLILDKQHLMLKMSFITGLSFVFHLIFMSHTQTTACVIFIIQFRVSIENEVSTYVFVSFD